MSTPIVTCGTKEGEGWRGKSKVGTVEGWERKRFDEIGTIFSGSTPSTSIRAFWDGEIVWVTPNDLSKLNTPYLHDSAKRITEKGLNGCSAHLLPPHSLVLSSRAPIGYVALPTVQFCTNQGCKTIKLKSTFHPEFTYYNVLLNIHEIKNLGEGTTFAEISKTALSTVELSFPALLTWFDINSKKTSGQQNLTSSIVSNCRLCYRH